MPTAMRHTSSLSAPNTTAAPIHPMKAEKVCLSGWPTVSMRSWVVGARPSRTHSSALWRRCALIGAATATVTATNSANTARFKPSCCSSASSDGATSFRYTTTTAAPAAFASRSNRITPRTAARACSGRGYRSTAPSPIDRRV